MNKKGIAFGKKTKVTLNGGTLLISSGDNSHLEDGHGGRSIYVRGHAKVFLHLAFGILVIAVEQVFKLLE